MVVSVMMIVMIVMIVIGRGTSAGCAHGELLKVVWKKRISFLWEMQYQLLQDAVYLSPNCS